MTGTLVGEGKGMGVVREELLRDTIQGPWIWQVNVSGRDEWVFWVGNRWVRV